MKEIKTLSELCLLEALKVREFVHEEYPETIDRINSLLNINDESECNGYQYQKVLESGIAIINELHALKTKADNVYDMIECIGYICFYYLCYIELCHKLNLDIYLSHKNIKDAVKIFTIFYLAIRTIGEPVLFSVINEICGTFDSQSSMFHRLKKPDLEDIVSTLEETTKFKTLKAMLD